jgi:hypothetical protein
MLQGVLIHTRNIQMRTLLFIREMATLVLVHGSCHGGWCCKKVIPLLGKHCHDLYTLTLTGLGKRSHLVNRDIGFDTHIIDITQVL